MKNDKKEMNLGRQVVTREKIFERQIMKSSFGWYEAELKRETE